MAQAFLITGLPRSRTAWLAAVANTVPGAICHHEPLERFPTWQASLGLWQSTDHEFAGISDSALGFHLGEILDSHAPRTLIVKRDPQQVLGALDVLGLGGDHRKYCTLLAKRLQQAEGHPLVKVVPFEHLTDHATVRSCLWHLMPAAAIDGDKLTLMQRLNVQASLRHVKASVASRRADIPALLGHDVVAELAV